jgi:frataxin-like iron-binding protein CyaY
VSVDWSEKDYRIQIKNSFDKLERLYCDRDPDELEVEPGLGTLIFQNQKGKIILSTQPSVRQLWLAAAHLGRALHFNFDHEKKQWWDDKGQGIELESCVRDFVKSLTEV